MARQLKRRTSLADVYPDVAATWHPERNGVWTPQNTSSKNNYKAWWRCAQGHEWQQIVADRTTLPDWKDGDRAACRVCVGHHVILTFSCGHTGEVSPDRAIPGRACSACRKARWEQRQQAIEADRPRIRAAFAQSRESAEKLVNELDIPDVPAPLEFEWRKAALHAVQFAIVQERIFGHAGAIEAALAEHRSAARQLLPLRNEVESARKRREPLKLFNRAHWATGWLHYLTPNTERAEAEPETVASLTDLLTTHVDAAAERYGGGEAVRTADITRWLTELVVDWAYNQKRLPFERWNVYRELTLPVTPGTSGRFGRLDVTALRPDGPDLVVEIDSAHKPESVQKLEFARDAGAVAVWVRWRGGRVETPDGVVVIDLVERTRGLTI
jgi:hypothetical protein